MNESSLIHTMKSNDNIKKTEHFVYFEVIKPEPLTGKLAPTYKNAS